MVWAARATRPPPHGSLSDLLKSQTIWTRTDNDQQFQVNVQTQGRLTTLEQFGNIVLRANPDGSLLRVRDVALVDLGAQNLDAESRLDGRPAVGIGIYLSPGANAVETARSWPHWTA
jgi:multidrug efflux pump subunit AcrB